VAWKTLKRWMHHLESRGEMLRISRPVDVEYEAGAIADLLVKNDGPAVLFEQPRLADGSISKIPLVMNIFGSNDRTLRALGASHETEVGDRMVAMMKPDIGAYMRAPWKALPLIRDALAMPPRKKWRGKCQRVRLDTDLTKLPIPKTWPMDGGPFVTLPLVVTKDPNSGEHNLVCIELRYSLRRKLVCIGKYTNTVPTMQQQLARNKRCQSPFAWAGRQN